MDETTGMTQDDARYSWVFKNTVQDLDFIVLISKSVRALAVAVLFFLICISSLLTKIGDQYQQNQFLLLRHCWGLNI